MLSDRMDQFLITVKQIISQRLWRSLTVQVYGNSLFGFVYCNYTVWPFFSNLLQSPTLFPGPAPPPNPNHKHNHNLTIRSREVELDHPFGSAVSTTRFLVASWKQSVDTSWCGELDSKRRLAYSHILQMKQHQMSVSSILTPLLARNLFIFISTNPWEKHLAI